MKIFFKNLLVIFMLVTALSGCNSIDNDNNGAASSEQTSSIVADIGTDTDATSSASIETNAIFESEETITGIQYYTPTKYGTGLEFKLPFLVGCSDDTVLNQEITYGCNRLLYGIGAQAGSYEVKDHFLAPQFVAFTKNYGKDEEGNFMSVYLELCYEVLTSDEKTVTITIDSEFGCSANRTFGGHPLGTSFHVQISDSSYYYTSYDSIEFFEILIGNEIAEGYYNIDSGDWTAIDSNNTGASNENPSENTLSDSALELEALFYLNQISSEIKYEYRNNGYKMCHASPNAAFTSVIHRTNDTALVQGRITIWLDGGGNPDGELTISLMINPYSGDLIDWYYK